MVNWVATLVFLLTLIAMLRCLSAGAEYKMATATMLLWLLVGISAPMLLLEARISSLEFTFAGTPVSFSDQVLFFKSKSIWEVVGLLLFAGNGMGPFLAGLGVFLFSVVIPLLKLSASFFWSPSAQWSASKAGQLLLFHSSKWAMADVMVVAIFLSNLGFDGLLQDVSLGDFLFAAALLCILINPNRKKKRSMQRLEKRPAIENACSSIQYEII